MARPADRVRPLERLLSTLPPLGAGGQFVEPTIFIDVTSTMRTAREEVFGLVLSICGVEDEAEAVRLANDTIYGFVAGVSTSDIGRAVRMSTALKASPV